MVNISADWELCFSKKEILSKQSQIEDRMDSKKLTETVKPRFSADCPILYICSTMKYPFMQDAASPLYTAFSRYLVPSGMD